MPGTLIHKVGDLFSSNASIIAHGVNIRGAFGSGVAGQISRRYPHIRDAYLSKYQEEGWQLGEVQLVAIGPYGGWRWVANMATQDNFGGPGVHVNYDAVKQCFTTLFQIAEGCEYDIAIPKIGAGLAGGDWGKIESIIIGLLTKYSVDVTCYSLA